MKSCPVWTPEKMSELARRSLAGESRAKIAAAMGRTIGSIEMQQGKLRKCGTLPPTVHTQRAHGALGARKMPGASERACLCCGHMFRSEGPHNRLCDHCRHQSADVPFVMPRELSHA